MEELGISYTDKQKLILEAAERLMSRHGFEGTSVRDIAQEAGVNLAMISYYFGSKDRLLEAIFKYRSETTRLQLESLILNTKLNPMEKLEKLVDDYIDKFIAQQGFQRIVMQEQMDRDTNPVYQRINEMKKRNYQYINRLVQEGQKLGVFKKKIDIPLMMTTMIGTTCMLLTTQRFYRELNGMEDMPEDQFQKLLRKKLSTHIKVLFKAILTHEA